MALVYRSRALANERHPLAPSHYAPDFDLLVGVEDAITTIESFPSGRCTTSQCHRTGQVGGAPCPSGVESGVQFAPAQFLGAPVDETCGE